MSGKDLADNKNVVTPKPPKKKRKKHGGGSRLGMRPTYERTIKPRLPFVRALAENGAALNTVADNLGISATTLRRWRSENPELEEALRASAAVADAQVVEKLYSEAMGYETLEIKKEYDIDDETGLLVVSKKTETTKFQRPSVSAQIFWLSNRNREKWRRTDGPDSGGAGKGIEIDYDAARERLGDLLSRAIRARQPDGDSAGASQEA